VGLKHRLSRFYFPEFLAVHAIRQVSPFSGIVLMYHEVLPDDFALPAWTVVRESDFRWQMSYLRSHFDVISLDQALARVEGKGTATRPFAVITFDDGYKGNFSTALPIMEGMGLPLTVYIATKAIIENGLYWYDRIINLLNSKEKFSVAINHDGHPEYFTIPRYGENRRWIAVQKVLNRLKQMAPSEREKTVASIASGISVTGPSLKMLNLEEVISLANSTCVTIGCHTHGHELLDQLSMEEVHAALDVANEHIRRITGKLPRHFAYPNGNFNKDVLDVVRSKGFESAVTTSPGLWSEFPRRMLIPRIGIGRFDGSSCFKAKVSGVI